MQMVIKTWLYGDAFRALLDMDMDMAMDNNSDDSGVSNSIALPPLSSLLHSTLLHSQTYLNNAKLTLPHGFPVRGMGRRY